MKLKVVQTKLTQLEYRLLREYAESRGLTIAEALREIIRKHVIDDRVYESDPFFTEGPVVKRKGAVEKTSLEHNKILYDESK
ncbi:MAG: hypothetical protein DRN04_03350 [Thermoprotei archaeon]|nr:MAG: hypothetical protein DRN04_03350 [Thermoprotei archaeon]